MEKVTNIRGIDQIVMCDFRYRCQLHIIGKNQTNQLLITKGHKSSAFTIITKNPTTIMNSIMLIKDSKAGPTFVTLSFA